MSKSQKKAPKSQRKEFVEFPLIHPNAAGIDIGDTLHVVAVPEGRGNGSNVRELGSFTDELWSIIKWLKECQVDTVAMESTGIYWRNLAQLLIAEDFEVYLVQGRHTRNITGKKTDESDAQWIQRLHSCGLLRVPSCPMSIPRYCVRLFDTEDKSYVTAVLVSCGCKRRWS